MSGTGQKPSGLGSGGGSGGGGGGGASSNGGTQAIQNLINNTGKGPPRDTTPLLHSSSTIEMGEDKVTRRSLKGLTLLVGVALVVAAILFGIIAVRRSKNSSVPYPSVMHPLQPTALWGVGRRPYPTGAWWINLVLDKGDNNVGVLPYAIKATNEAGIEISYSNFRHLSTKLVQADLWAPDMRFGSIENVTKHYVESYDPLSVGIVFTTASHPEYDRPSYYRTHLVRGCPYITVEYYEMLPLVEASNMITVINGLQFKDDSEFEAPALTGSVFEITVISGQQWMLFAEPPITLKWTRNGQLAALSPYTGLLRLAVAPKEEVKPALVEYWRAYPTGGDVLLDYQQGDMITYQWRKKGDGRLLMLALPHHVDILQDATKVKAATGVYTTLKGSMTAVLGDRWYLKETLPEISWNAPRPIAKDKVDDIKKAVAADVVAIEKNDHKRWNKTDPDDPYWEGKRMAMYARLALIADEVGMTSERDQAVSYAEKALDPWLLGQNNNPLLYDQTWGGLIVQNGLTNPYVNFGNTYYNDHHFMYGYFAYTAAVIAKFDRGYYSKHSGKIRAIVQDIMNIDDTNPFFPLARHKDFYDGHSWASGLFVQNNGKSQESSSEAINAYYAVHLFGKATGDRKLERFAKLLMAMEIRSTKMYWHMLNGTSIYDPVFAANKMVGVVGALDATCQTWFGEKFEFVHGINFMPFTAITEAYLDPAYVGEEYPVLATVLGRTNDPVEEEWLGFIYLDHAILDPEAAWKDVNTLQMFDSGNSLSNSLYWIATRPTTKTDSSSKGTTQLASSSSILADGGPALGPGPVVIDGYTNSSSDTSSSSSPSLRASSAAKEP